MKKLNKLLINSERLMKNEELMTLRGGYGACTTICYIGSCAQGYVLCSGDCTALCRYIFGPSAFGSPAYC